MGTALMVHIFFLGLFSLLTINLMFFFWPIRSKEYSVPVTTYALHTPTISSVNASDISCENKVRQLNKTFFVFLFGCRYNFYVCYKHALYVEDLPKSPPRHQRWSSRSHFRSGFRRSNWSHLSVWGHSDFSNNFFSYSSPRMSGFICSSLLHGQMEIEYVHLFSAHKLISSNEFLNCRFWSVQTNLYGFLERFPSGTIKCKAF
jgi:hypothetical protein